MARRDDAFRDLVALLRRAHAGELAAYLAYEGHWRSLRDPLEASEVRAIAREELLHRRDLGLVLNRLGRPPAPFREALFGIIGRCIGTLCHVGGWFAPMYGAGFLERGNIDEYEEGAALALDAGQGELVEPLHRMAWVEREHERYFRSKVESHWLTRIVPIWAAPEPAAEGHPSLKKPPSPALARFDGRGPSGERAFGRSRRAPVPRTSSILRSRRVRS
jgi:rubrerythrin